MATDILMLIKTSELKFDDRLKKEISSLTDLKKNVAIRAVIQNNKSGSGIIFGSIRYKTYKLISRSILPQKKYLAIKAIEMYLLFLWSTLVIHPKIVWIHNVEMIGLLKILRLYKKLNIVQRIVWDQHELPTERYFTNSKYKLRLAQAYECADIVIAANEARMNFIKEHFNINSGKVILNLPNTSFRDNQKQTLLPKYLEWTKGREYFITTALIDDNYRYASKIAEAILKFDSFCLVVMGQYSQDTIRLIEKNVNFAISDRVLFTGLVNHEEIINLTDNAFGSIVFYNVDKLNNKYCAPNRLFQAAVRGVPLIAGCNPPLVEFIQKYEVGISLKSDGRNVADIVEAITHFKLNRNIYLENISKIKHIFDWSLNNDVINEIANS